MIVRTSDHLVDGNALHFISNNDNVARRLESIGSLFTQTKYSQRVN